MRRIRTLTLLGTLAAAGDTVGCQDATNRTCPAVTGVFLASYQQIDGSCPATFEGNQLDISKTDVGTVTRVEMRLSNTVRTQVVLKGCTIGLSQAVEAMGYTQSQLAGDLNVDSDAALSGQVMRTVYMPDGAIQCHGVYDARFMRQDPASGAAGTGATTTP